MPSPPGTAIACKKVVISNTQTYVLGVGIIVRLFWMCLGCGSRGVMKRINTAQTLHVLAL